MDQTKKKIEEAFNIIEHRMINSGRLAATDRKRELEQIDTAVAQLESELDRFQMIAFTKYPAEIDEFEERLVSIKNKLKKMNEEGITASQVVEQAQAEVVEETQMEDAAQRLIAETNAKLKEGKERALGMLKTVNNMKEELNLIDDEIMLQREKMVGIRDKMKQTQSMVYQTKKIARNLAQSLNSDIWIKILLGLITLAILGAVVMIAITKMQETAKAGLGAASPLDSFTQKDYDEIDEQFFHDLETNPEVAAKTFGVQTASSLAGGAAASAGAKAVDDGSESPDTKPKEGEETPEGSGEEAAGDQASETIGKENEREEEQREQAGSEEGKDSSEEEPAEQPKEGRRLSSRMTGSSVKMTKRLQSR